MMEDIKMKTIISKIYGELLRVKSSESILIICDKKTKKTAEQFFEYSMPYGSHTLCLEIKEGSMHGQEPPLEVVKLMQRYDVILLITSKSLSHTNARKKATAKGSRIITMPGITSEILKRCVDIDYNQLSKLHRKIKALMKKAKIITIKTKRGTDISFEIYNDKIESSTTLHRAGDFHNIPLGEVFVSPKEGTSSGVYVVDGSHSGIGKLQVPLKIVVKKGMATKISSKRLDLLLKSIKNKKAYNIAEFGIGTNPKAKLTGLVLEDEKVRGTCHIALGNNYSFGGKVNVPIHLDGIIKKPTIYFDNKVIMKDGRFLISD
jgi:aminopeptidase